jgi:transposase InsO family protein
MDDKDRRAIALWRLGVLGPLVSARLEHGDRQEHLREIAGRAHQMPDGRVVRLSARTIESWYYLHKRGGFEALHPATRADCGQSRAIAPSVAELIVRVKREKPRRSIKRIIRMLERAKKVEPGELSRSSVHRLLQLAGISIRPVRGPSKERRSFLAEHAGDLWVGDALHGPLVIAPGGKLRKSYLLSQIDNATRYILHSYFALSEGAAEQEYGMKQAILKYGVPRGYYVDRGSAYIATSLRLICAELDIHLLHAGVKDAEAKGVIERWHRTLREELLDELPGHPISLADLNAKLWAWLGAEYHARKHDTTQRAPREHLFAEAGEIRAVPRDKDMDELFLHREERFVRKDGTVRWRGGFLEVRPELCGKTIELRFESGDEAPLPRAFLGGSFACDTVPLDRRANMTRRRRRIQGEPAPDATPSGLDPLGLIEDEHYRRTRLLGTGKDEEDDPEEDEER